jgi:hypothetical protein
MVPSSRLSAKIATPIIRTTANSRTGFCLKYERLNTASAYVRSRRARLEYSPVLINRKSWIQGPLSSTIRSRFPVLTYSTNASRDREGLLKPMDHMAKHICQVCLRVEGNLRPGQGKSESREVSLAAIQSAAEDCSLCSFVKGLIEDGTTREMDRSEYEDAMVRVEDEGLRFTGQWQGALVVEVYEAGESSLPLFRFVIRI